MPLKRKIFVINLPHETARYNFVKEQFERFGLDVERSDGVNAAILTPEYLATVYSPEKNRKGYVRPLSKGQIACFLAHYNAWKKIIDEDLDYAVILEDDAKISDDFPKALEFMDITFGEWEFLRIQSNAKLKKIFCEDKRGYFSFAQYINTSGDALAQAISKKTAEKLVNNMIPFGIPVDVSQQYFYKIGIRVDSLRPPVVSTSTFSDDSILNRFHIKAKSHYPFVRQTLSFKFYIGRIVRLIREYGLKATLSNLFKMFTAPKIR